ncbi:hypothetical protein EB796_007415 [Bugula neritina]|uniref:C2H2-type domain-containing protein n=1 Tax=Bugula neritina TaxID=10212 RepID=A0A7J7K6N0_BUGNE|nr:hypothetical protein EB796_007415 [Bugula neritina]
MMDEKSPTAAWSRPTILREGEEIQYERVEDDIWACPFCDPVKKLFTSAESVKEHIHVEHSKKQVLHNGWVIFKCNQACGVLRDRSHYHCPTCDKAVISRGDFVFHLKGHDMQKGTQAARGRKKTLATVMSNEAGLQHIQLFSHASLVVSPTILALIDDQQKFWNELQLKTGMTCLRDGEEGQQFCVLQGQYDSVIKANTFLEKYVLNKLHDEVAAQLHNDRLYAESQVAAADGEVSLPSASAQNSQADESPDVRKSARKRKPNTMLDEYITPKSAKLEHGVNLASSNAAAVRQSTVAQSLMTTVEQECHITLSKNNIQNGEYHQVHLLFPPPIITHPPPEEPPSDLSNIPTLEEDNSLEPTDDEEGEDLAADSAASEEEMEPEVDEITMKSVEVNKSQSNVFFRCNQCSIDFPSIDLLMAHKQAVHDPSSNLPRVVDIAQGPGEGHISSADAGTATSLHYCKECNFSTSTKQTLKLHVSRVHREKQLECLDCGEKFGPLIDLKTHIRETGHRKGQHTNLYKQMVECKICNKKLQLKNLKSHTELVHDKLKPYSCEVCGKMFGTRFLVKEHMESHKNLQDRHRPWKCHLCGQAFFKKLPLDEHINKHMGTPQYSCDKCPKKFFHQSGWKRHLQHHGEDRPFHCNVCGKSFKTSTNLSAHKTVHAPMAFMCLCGKSYQQKHTLKYHQDKCPMHQDILANQLVEESYHAAPRYMCGFCQETFTDFNLVQEHVKQHVSDSPQVEANFEGELSLAPNQSTGQQAIADISGSGLDHLAMTAAVLEQQNMVTTEGERTLIVTDLGQEQLQLVTYPNGTIIDQDGQVIDPSHQRLIDQEGRIIDPSGQIVEQTGSQFNITISQPVTNIHVEQVGGGQNHPTLTRSLKLNLKAKR